MKMDNKKIRNTIFFFQTLIMIGATLACNLGEAVTPAAAPTLMPTLAALAPKTTNVPAPTPTTNTAPECFKGIQAGLTTKDQVINLLGQPLGSESTTDYENLLYPSPLNSQFNSLIIQNNLVVRADRIVAANNALKFSEVKKLHGVAPYTAYSAYQHWAKIYLYPTQGLAFVANENLDTVFIQQCFTPMTFEKYQSAWGEELFTKDPFLK